MRQQSCSQTSIGYSSNVIWNCRIKYNFGIFLRLQLNIYLYFHSLFAYSAWLFLTARLARWLGNKLPRNMWIFARSNSLSDPQCCSGSGCHVVYVNLYICNRALVKTENSSMEQCLKKNLSKRFTQPIFLLVLSVKDEVLKQLHNGVIS